MKYSCRGVVVVCLFLRILGLVNSVESCRVQSVHLTTLLLGTLSPLNG